jgi:hypothetical protein
MNPVEIIVPLLLGLALSTAALLVGQIVTVQW